MLDIWTKGTTFPRECLDELERQLSAAAAASEPAPESTTPPFSPALPPLELKNEASNGGVINGQGKFCPFFPVVVVVVVVSCFEFRSDMPAQCPLQDPAIAFYSTPTRSTTPTIRHPLLTLDPHLTYIHVALPHPTPGMHPLRRRAVIRRTHSNPYETRLHDVLPGSPGSSPSRRARSSAGALVQHAVVHGHEYGMRERMRALRGSPSRQVKDGSGWNGTGHMAEPGRASIGPGPLDFFSFLSIP